MSTYNGFMNIYNGSGGAITKVKAIHTTEKGTSQEISLDTLAAGASAAAVAIIAYSDQDDNWTIAYVDSNNTQRSVGFNDCSFKSEDGGGTVVYNLSPGAVKLCFPQSDDNLETF